jgi:hypothetical protein
MDGAPSFVGWLSFQKLWVRHLPAHEQGFRTALPGRESMAWQLSQGFALGYFRLLPPGGNVQPFEIYLHRELPVCIISPKNKES